MMDIDRYLSTESEPRDPARLEAAVMRRLRREAARPAPLPFLWLRFSIGLAAGALLCTLVALHGPSLVG